MNISIIIPTLNEAERISLLIARFLSLPGQEYLLEIIISDGGSTDDTVQVVKATPARLIISPGKGRALQMNYAAQQAHGKILYFVHADFFPPKSCLLDIIDAVQSGNLMGCFTYVFDKPGVFLKINGFLTNIHSIASGGGDQSLYILKEEFKKYNGFREELPIMEDFDFVWRAKKELGLHIIRKNAVVSSRKYDRNSYLWVQFINFLVFTGFRMGNCPHKLAEFYKKALQRKNTTTSP